VPPSTVKTCPVLKLAQSEAKQSTAADVLGLGQRTLEYADALSFGSVCRADVTQCLAEVIIVRMESAAAAVCRRIIRHGAVGRDAIDRDAMLSDFLGQNARKRMYGAFGRRID